MCESLSGIGQQENNVDLDLWPCIMKLFAWFTMIFHMSKRKYIANKPEESCCGRPPPFSACFCAFLAFWNNRISTNWSTHIMIWINWTMKFSCGFMILKFNNSYWKLIHRLFAYQYLSKQLYWIKELVKFNSVKTIEYLFHLGPLSYPLHPGPQSPHFLLCTIQRDDVIWTELFATLKWRSIEKLHYLDWILSLHFLLCTIQRDDVIWTELFATLKWATKRNLHAQLHHLIHLFTKLAYLYVNFISKLNERWEVNRVIFVRNSADCSKLPFWK